MADFSLSPCPFLMNKVSFESPSTLSTESIASEFSMRCARFHIALYCASTHGTFAYGSHTSFSLFSPPPIKFLLSKFFFPFSSSSLALGFALLQHAHIFFFSYPLVLPPFWRVAKSTSASFLNRKTYLGIM